MKSSTTLQDSTGRGYAIAFVSAFVLSTTALFISRLSRDFGMPPLVLAFWRDLFVTACLAPILAIFRPASLRINRGDLPFLALFGLALALFNTFLTISVAQNGASVSTVLVYSSAPFAAILGRVLLKEKLGFIRLAVIAFCLAGCVLAAGALDPGAWRASPLGILSGFLSGLGYAVYSMMGKRASERGIGTWTALLYAFGFASLFLLGLGLLPGGIIPGNSFPPPLFMLGWKGEGWLLLLALAAGPTLVGFGLYIASMAYLSAGKANLIVMTEVGITALLAYLFMGERLSGFQALGAALLFGGVLGMRALEGRAARSSARPQGPEGEEASRSD